MNASDLDRNLCLYIRSKEDNGLDLKRSIDQAMAQAVVSPLDNFAMSALTADKPSIVADNTSMQRRQGTLPNAEGLSERKHVEPCRHEKMNTLE